MLYDMIVCDRTVCSIPNQPNQPMCKPCPRYRKFTTIGGIFIRNYILFKELPKKICFQLIVFSTTMFSTVMFSIIQMTSSTAMNLYNTWSNNSRVGACCL